MKLFLLLLLFFSALTSYSQIGLSLKSDFGMNGVPSGDYSWRVRNSAVVPNVPSEPFPGDIISIGTYQGTLKFDNTVSGTPITINPTGLEDVFIARFAPNGKCRWVKAYGSTGSDIGGYIAITPDALNNNAIYVSFVFGAGITINSQFFTPVRNDGALLRLNDQGNVVWHKVISTAQNDQTYSVAANSTTVYMSGNQTFMGSGEAFIYSFDATNGNQNWVEIFDGAGQVDSYDDIVLEGNTIYFAGNMAQGVYDNIPFNPIGPRDLCVGSFDIPTRKLNWIVAGGATIYGRGWGIVKNGPNIYAAGVATGNIPSFNQTSKGGNDIMVTHVTENGVLQSSKLYGSTGDDIAYNIGATNSSYYVSGTVKGDMMINNQNVVSHSLNDIVLINFKNATTDALCAKILGSETSLNDYGDALFKVPNEDSLYFSATFGKDVKDENNVLIDAGSYPNNAFLMKIGGTCCTTPKPSVKLVDGCWGTNSLGLISPENYISFQWYLNGAIIPNATGSTFLYSKAGSYTVIAIGNECINPSTPSDVFTISSVPNPATPPVTIGTGTTGNDIITLGCPNLSQQLKANVTNPVQGRTYNYKWEYGNNIQNGASPDFTISSPITCNTKAKVTVTDNTDPLCIATASVTFVCDYLKADIATTTSCPGGNNGTITSTVSGGRSPYQYDWSDNANIHTSTRTQLPVGNYVLTVTDNDGCKVIKNIIIIQAISDLKINPTFTQCINGKTNVSANVTGGSAPYTYTWVGLPIIQNGSTILNVPKGTVLTLTVADANGCKVEKTIPVSCCNAVVVLDHSIKESYTTPMPSMVIFWKTSPVNAGKARFRYRIVGANLPWITTGYYNPGATIITAGLLKQTCYEVEAMVDCGGVNNGGNWTTLFTNFCTPGGSKCNPFNVVNSAPLGIYVNQITNRSAMVHWQPVSHYPNAAPYGYIVAYGLKSQNPTSWSQYVVCHPITEFMMNNLSSNKVYGVRVRTNCSNCSTALNSNNQRSNWEPIPVIEFRTPTLKTQDDSYLQNAEKIQIYPNPAKDRVTLQMESGQNEEITLRITDALGRMVSQQKVDIQEGSNQIQIPLIDMASGLYILSIESSDGKKDFKLMVE